jgi:hypothetical protein
MKRISQMLKQEYFRENIFNFEEMIIHCTPYSTLRMWIYFDESSFEDYNKKSEARNFMAFLSFYNGADKVGFNEVRKLYYISYEFPMTLKDFFYETFKDSSRVDVSNLRK